MVFLERLLPQAEIAWALLPRRLLPGSPAPGGWRKFPQFRRIRGRHRCRATPAATAPAPGVGAAEFVAGDFTILKFCVDI